MMEETQSPSEVTQNDKGAAEGEKVAAKNGVSDGVGDAPRESSPDNDPRSESEDFQSASPEPESDPDDGAGKPKGRPRRDRRGYNNARQRKRQKEMEEAAASSGIQRHTSLWDFTHGAKKEEKLGDFQHVNWCILIHEEKLRQLSVIMK